LVKKKGYVLRKMSLQTLQEDLNKYEFNGLAIANKLKDILHLEEASSVFYTLIPIDVDNVTVKLDEEATLKIIFDAIGQMRFSFITKETTSSIIFKDSRAQQSNCLVLSDFYKKIEPYKEVLEDKIEESFRKEIEFDRLVKKEN
jgi:hypothetical protein